MVLAGCASVKNPTPGDPLEGYNRNMFAFNDAVDRNLLTPVAKGYQAVVPSPVRTCVTNIFNNFGDIWSGVNSFLQGRGLDSVNTFGRVLFNSTMGLGGCIDVASMKGAPRIQNDFGTTLGVWGIGQGLILCCRCWAHQRSAIPPVRWATASAAPQSMLRLAPSVMCRCATRSGASVLSTPAPICSMPAIS
ncbi:lipoprotein [Advenella kashmirensis WT001]|uniref:Lipoprotein n=1 Tax=Advenella kashmirensis (strain DSM 17095 / LMG 22695 / WT001) TaxID=1036672 RepID=I3U881_ADVKW|nr:lipoprotein [Advenella kashmirensis WT001]